MQKAARNSIAIFATMLLDQWLIWYQLVCGASCSATLIRNKIRLERCNQALQMWNEIIMRPVDKYNQSTRNPWNRSCHHFKVYCSYFTRILHICGNSPYKLWVQLEHSIQSSIRKKKSLQLHPSIPTEFSTFGEDEHIQVKSQHKTPQITQESTKPELC